MEPRIWNYPFPKRYVLGGQQSAIQEHPLLDQSWVLCRNSNDPSMIAVEPLQKTPREEFRFFPRFRDKTFHRVSSQEYDPSPTIDYFSWDWIEWRYEPLKDVEVRTINWCPEPRVICGEIWISSQTARSGAVYLDLACSPQSHGRGNRISLKKVRGRHVLTGWIGSHNMILFMSGNPELGEDPYPYLENKLSLSAHDAERIHWICILSEAAEQGIKLLEKTLQMDWAGEIARRKVTLQSQIEITTGNPDWDYVLGLSQKEGRLIYHQNAIHSDQNFPQTPDFSPIQALMALQSLVIPTPEMAKNILDLVFNANVELGMAGNTEDHGPAPSILAGELLWQIQQSGFSGELWSGYLDKTSRWLKNWFTPGLDKDGDGIPELINNKILQTPGLDAAAGSQSSDNVLPFPYLESPALAALLFNDLSKIDGLLELVGRNFDHVLQERVETLRAYLLDSWMPEDSEFPARDSLSHLAVDRFIIHEGLQKGLNILMVDMPQPTRIGIIHHRHTEEPSPGNFRVIYHGMDWRGNYRIEEQSSGDLIWGERFNWGISESVYSRIDYCSLMEYDKNNQVSLIAPSTSSNDITNTLPLWAGILPDDQTLEICEKVLLDPERHWSPYGFSQIPGVEEMVVSLFWNLLLGQALFKLGMIKNAAELIKRWMDVIIPSLKRSGSLHPCYSVQTGQGLGQENYVESLFPVKFFLKVLGVEIYPEGRVLISGKNPFPWPVSISYRGFVIKREKVQTIIMSQGEEKRILIDPDHYQLDLV